MQTQLRAEAQAHVLDRVLYLLEENSVAHLMRNDTKFAEYVSELYKQVHTQSSHLRAVIN